MDVEKFEKVIEVIQKLGFPIVMALGLLWFANNVYNDGLVREARLVNRIDSFDQTLKEVSETMKFIEEKLERIDK